jgi:hypothetical protein
MQYTTTPIVIPEMEPDVIPEMEPGVEPGMVPGMAPCLVPGVVTAKEKRLTQLAQARASAVSKKRKMSEDVDTLHSKIDALTSMMRPAVKVVDDIEMGDKEPDDEPVAKRVRVTKEPDGETIEEPCPKGSWGQFMFRNVGLAALAGGSWYLQNVYAQPKGKTGPAATNGKATKRPFAPPPKQALLPPVVRTVVGRSGFVL